MNEWMKLYDKTKSLRAGSFVEYDEMTKIIGADPSTGTYNREVRKWKEELFKHHNIMPRVKANLGYKLVRVTREKL